MERDARSWMHDDPATHASTQPTVGATTADAPMQPTGAAVAADASTATLRRALRSSGIRWNSLMVSKLDESVQPWPLVEFLCDNFLPLSAASDGVRIEQLYLGNK